MNGRYSGGCCIARYSGGCGEINYGISKVDKIMLKFRPIAPKPVAAGSASSCSTDGYGGTLRRKRKYVRVNGKQTRKSKVSVPTSSSVSGGGDEVVTLSLMPETPDRKEKYSPERSSETEIPDLVSPITLRTEVCYGHVQQASGHVVSVTDHHTVVMASPPQVVSFVTVECVTDTCPSLMNMEMDTCPSFITNSRDTVVRTNKAYREMISGGGSDEIVVKKYNQVTVPVALPAFTCKVKVTWGSESTSSASTVTAPCDVWRLQSGGCAWRLDVKAALCLGR